MAFAGHIKYIIYKVIQDCSSTVIYKLSENISTFQSSHTAVTLLTTSQPAMM